MTTKEIEITGMLVRAKPHSDNVGGEVLTIADYDRDIHITYIDHKFMEPVSQTFYKNAKIKIIIEYDDKQIFKAGH